MANFIVRLFYDLAISAPSSVPLKWDRSHLTTFYFNAYVHHSISLPTGIFNILCMQKSNALYGFKIIFAVNSSCIITLSNMFAQSIWSIQQFSLHICVCVCVCVCIINSGPENSYSMFYIKGVVRRYCFDVKLFNLTACFIMKCYDYALKMAGHGQQSQQCTIVYEL